MKVTTNFLKIDPSFTFSSELKPTLKQLLAEEHKTLAEINLIFTSNPEILEINKEFLNHHYFTDVITFPDNKRNRISGDIYVSVDQVVINAKAYNSSFINELSRVIIHGTLHLAGYKDTTEVEKTVMRRKEDVYLCRFKWEKIIIEK